MKKNWVIVFMIAISGVAGTQASLAAKADGPKARFFEKYDKNHNGKIDEDEKDAIRKDYAANPEGELKRFDKNHDGKLDDDEIAAIKPPTRNTAARRRRPKNQRTRNRLANSSVFHGPGFE